MAAKHGRGSTDPSVTGPTRTSEEYLKAVTVGELEHLDDTICLAPYMAFRVWLRDNPDDRAHVGDPREGADQTLRRA